MSPASKSKSKDKKSGKEPIKTASKPSGPATVGSGVPASAYNPLLGTFHSLETVSNSSASPLQANGRFRTIDETDEQSGSFAVGVEFDSVSNNGSWSGESEDHKENKSNLSGRQESVPGADNDKREKIRQKNEKKHQRQKERRAQELQERCSGYLMSRKLEALAQQLVAMGFSHERATMALIMNEGRVEESVAWLFEGSEEADTKKDKKFGGTNLKIDITEELSQITNMVFKFKCSKQEVERAVVSCEGDLEKAAEMLRTQKQELSSAPSKPEESGDPSGLSNCKLSATVAINSGMSQLKPNPSLSAQLRRDERDYNYTRGSGNASGYLESGPKNVQSVKRFQQKLDWMKPQHSAMPAEKSRPGAGSGSMATPVQVLPSPAKGETRYIAVGGELKHLPLGTVREPVIMMQRPQSANAKQVPAISVGSPPGTGAGWHPSNGIDIMKSGVLLPQIPSGRSLGAGNLSSGQIYPQFYYQQQLGLGSSPLESPGNRGTMGFQQHQQFIQGGGLGDMPGTTQGNGSWSRTNAPPTLAAASSLGLFSGLNSSGSSGAASPVDWSNSSVGQQFDYTNVDWSLDRGLSSPRSTNWLMGLTSLMKNKATMFDSDVPTAGSHIGMRPAPPSNGNGVSLMGLQDASGATTDTSAPGSREWTSPFEGKDLFSLPREFVSSPSL
ncbi:uncharacterized protein LOC115735443 [Rhodamnia argentea]|uniref:Uncharacterized protein LOC115735443 n=1 Tax=Rhodamnia argentea TaxID=178133 RepID=A0A8B8NJ78_9MYRT|nr:uncharacterized protein LOC115735443 [Rhodamnia argentea]